MSAVLVTEPSVSSTVVSKIYVVVCRLSVTFLLPTQAIEIFRNVLMPFGTLAIC